MTTHLICTTSTQGRAVWGLSKLQISLLCWGFSCPMLEPWSSMTIYDNLTSYLNRWGLCRHDLCNRYIKVTDLWLHPRTSLSVRCSQHVGILWLCNLGLFIFLSFGQDVISKSEPTDDNKGLGVSRFKVVSLIHLAALYMEDGGKVVIYATLPQISIHFTTLRTTRGEER